MKKCYFLFLCTLLNACESGGIESSKGFQKGYEWAKSLGISHKRECVILDDLDAAAGCSRYVTEYRSRRKEAANDEIEAMLGAEMESDGEESNFYEDTESEACLTEENGETFITECRRFMKN